MRPFEVGRGKYPRLVDATTADEAKQQGNNGKYKKNVNQVATTKASGKERKGPADNKDYSDDIQDASHDLRFFR